MQSTSTIAHERAQSAISSGRVRAFFSKGGTSCAQCAGDCLPERGVVHYRIFYSHVSGKQGILEGALNMEALPR